MKNKKVVIARQKADNEKKELYFMQCPCKSEPQVVVCYHGNSRNLKWDKQETSSISLANQEAEVEHVKTLKAVLLPHLYKHWLSVFSQRWTVTS